MIRQDWAADRRAREKQLLHIGISFNPVRRPTHQTIAAMDNYHDNGDERVVYDEKLSSSNFDIDPPSIGCFYRFRKELSCSYGFFSPTVRNDRACR